MKFRLLACICVLLGCVIANAQTLTTIELLEGKKWEMQFPSQKDYSHTVEFKKWTWEVTFIYESDTIFDTKRFYLSDKKEEFFDSNKKPKLKTGKIIVKLSINKKTKKETVSNYEIIVLNADTLILRNLSKGYLLTYKLVK